ncbi:MAG: ABC transporter substrate-binding protein [Candidatus Methanomethylicia archaeon]
MNWKLVSAILVIALIIVGYIAIQSLTTYKTYTITSTEYRTTVTTAIEYRTVTKTVTTPPPKYPLTVMDFLGRNVNITKPPLRIVSCSPLCTEVAAVLELTDFIVGVDDYTDFPPSIVKLKEQGKVSSVGGVTTLSVEAVATLKPDLVLVSASLQKKFIPTLEELGLTVIALDARNINDVYSEILILGKVTGREELAERIVNEMKDRIEAIQQSLAAVRVKVKVFQSSWLEPIWTTGNGTFLNDIIRLAGGYNVFMDASGWITVSPESIVERNPEVIFIGCTMMGLKPEDVELKLKQIPGLENVEAVRKNRVYLLYEQAENIFVRAGPRVAEAIELLAKILYPEVFNTNIPNVIGDNYLNYVKPMVKQ